MILDKQAALERLEHDLELYEEICGIFREDVPKILEQLKAACRDKDFSLATRHAHSIKSAAANIGADFLSAVARSAEDSLRGKTIDLTKEMICDLEQNMALVLKELEQHRPTESNTAQ
jgi:HPt (histidine-containing phosphotransfer) domain-containing protein